VTETPPKELWKESAVNFQFEEVSVVGLGYIGLPTATVVANQGFQVYGLDVNQHAVDTINRGEIHIVEPGLDAMVKKVVEKGLLKASLEPHPADVFVIAVPTPFKENHEPDTSYIESALRAIAPVLKAGNLVLLESTSPVGTTEWMACALSELRSDLRFPRDEEDEADVALAYCPERVLPGKVIEELRENDRVIGGVTPNCTRKAVQFYKSFVNGDCIRTNARTAEMVKLTENASRDVSIAFANELSLICDKLDIDVWELIHLANHHPRVNILQPGPGVGGHCISVDPWFIVNKNPEEARLIHMARLVNDGKPRYVVQKVLQALPSKATKVACLGLAFKPNIDDLRESPAVQIVEELSDNGVQVLAVEPHVTALPEVLSGRDNLQLTSLKEALEQSEVVVVLVDHDVFSQLGLSDVKGKILIDTRGMIR
jgi:UDP-N-acetyl-D-mannosaminuronic acid dehydrogenase